MPGFWVGLVIGAAIGLAAGLALAPRLRRRRAGASTLAELLQPSEQPRAAEAAGEIAALRQNLRLKCLHNEALVERLVAAERERLPGANEAKLLRAAIERWERDNR